MVDKQPSVSTKDNPLVRALARLGVGGRQCRCRLGTTRGPDPGRRAHSALSGGTGDIVVQIKRFSALGISVLRDRLAFIIFEIGEANRCALAGQHAS
jgi:hypothetical protein